MRIMKKGIKLLVFSFIFILTFSVVCCVFSDKDINWNQHEKISDFYRETPGSLDAVWIGASHVYCSYQAPVGWGQSGIAIYPYSSGSQPIGAVPFLIEEVKKTQPQALIIVNLNEIVENGVANLATHFLADWMPLSLTKIEMIRYLYDNNDGADMNTPLEYIFPIIRFHSRWNRLTWQDLHYTETGGMKGAVRFNPFLATATDVSENDRTATTPMALTEIKSKILKDILDYCDENEVNILFVVVPQYTEDESRDAKYLSAQEYITARGYPVLNVKESMRRGVKLKLDLTQDYLDQLHTNIHGSIKMSDFVCQYLAENYGFTDKRGDPNYASWDEAYEKYKALITPYLTEEELAQLP